MLDTNSLTTTFSVLPNDPSRPVRLTKFRVTPQPTYTLDEVNKLLASCRVSTKEGVRNHAIISVLFDSGVRESELVSMGIPDSIYESKKSYT